MTTIAHVRDLIRARLGARSPLIVGVTGAVAAGKSVFAGELAETLRTKSRSVEILCTDGFLMANAKLGALGLLNRKGFPESYDTAALRAALAAVREGPIDAPGYSHVIYDVDPKLTRRLEPPRMLIVEGLGLQEGASALGLDALIYLHADEALLEAWFEARLLGLWRAARTDPTSFYALFRHMDEAEVRVFAGQVWRHINLPNLREHISRGRAVADIVVTKGEGHRILTVSGA